MRPDSVEEREVTGQQYDGPAVCRGCTERARRYAVDPVCTAVAEYAQSRTPHGQKRVEVADRHAVRDVEDGVVG